jgi:hypothetical protein
MAALQLLWPLSRQMNVKRLKRRKQRARKWTASTSVLSQILSGKGDK